MSVCVLSDGTRLHYRVQGRADGPWLVLMNGLLSDMRLWAGAIPFLRPHFRILTFDGRHQGHSRAGTRESSHLRTQVQGAKDAQELLKRLEIAHPWLVGLSHGASVALELLSHHPGEFAGAVLASALPNIDFITQLRIQHWIQCLDHGGPLLLFDAAAPMLWGERFLERRYAILRAHAGNLLLGPGQHARDAKILMAGALDWDIRARLLDIQQPLLLLAGAEDLLTPPWKGLQVARLLPNARFEVFPEVGHAIPVEAPPLFAARILAFIHEHPMERN